MKHRLIFKRTIAALSAFLICAGAMPYDGFISPQTNVFRVVADASPTGDAIFANYSTQKEFHLNSIDDLTAFANAVNSGKDFSGKTVVLNADITEEFTTVIGKDGPKFSGTFDGQGHTVKLNINDSVNGYSKGLFGNLYHATVKNVNVTGNIITINNTGGICGYCNYSTIENCSSNVSITGGGGVGGVVGCFEYGTIINCSSNSTITSVTGNAAMVGGIVGAVRKGKVLNCYSNGNITHTNTNSMNYFGGVCGWIQDKDCTVENCYSSGEIKSTGAGMLNTVGGAIGGMLGIASNCYYDSTKCSKAGGFGKALTTENCQGEAANSLYDFLNKNVTEHNASLAAGDIAWTYWTAEGTTYPEFISNQFNTTIEISTKADLDELADMVNSGYTFEGMTIKLTADITDEFTTVIGYNDNLQFKGTFDGQGHTVNLNINKPGVEDTAMFGSSRNATFKNIKTTGKVVGGYSNGALCGIAFNTTIENCSNNAEVIGQSGVGTICGCLDKGTIINCSNSGNVSGSVNMAGGICGALRTGKVINCYSNGNVAFIGTGTAKQVGGVCGWIRDSDGLVENCYSSGTITSSTISNGTVGSAVGDIENGKALNCYYDSTKCLLTGESGTGLETANCQGAPWGNLNYLLNYNAILHNKNLAANETPWSYWYSENTKYPVFANDQLAPTFEISTKADLDELADMVNSGYTFEGMTIKLTADITEEFTTVIGSSTTPFSGTFDGQGHTIKLNINKPAVNDSALFGYSSNATFKNINTTGKVVGNYSTGGVCGIAFDATIENCSNSAKIIGVSGVGGVCACLDHGTIVNSTNSGNISASLEMGGGICGALRAGNVFNCCSYGDIAFTGTATAKQVGGVCGWIRDNDGLVENCFSCGTITSTTADNGTVGGAVGDIVNGKASNCYYDSTKCLLTGESGTGLETANCQGATWGNLNFLLNYNAILHNKNLAANETPWSYWYSENTKYPVFANDQLAPTFEISTKADLDELADMVQSGITFEGMRIKLTADINDEFTTVIGSQSTPFSGTFDGQGHTIKLNINKSDTDYVGLFCYISGATIKNVITDGTVNGKSNVGGICSHSDNNSTISNCINKATVKSVNEYAGGIVSYGEGVKVINCVNIGEITAKLEAGGVCGFACYDSIIINCGNKGNVGIRADGWHTGGIAASLTGEVYNCYNCGSINGGKDVGGIVGFIGESLGGKSHVSNCYSTGSVGGNSLSTNAVIGTPKSCEITNCYYKTIVNTDDGLTEEECKGKGNLYESLNANVTAHNTEKPGDIPWEKWYAVDEEKKNDTVLVKATYPKFAPNEIKNIEDLYLFAEAVDNGKTYKGEKVVLNVDITEPFKTVIGEVPTDWKGYSSVNIFQGTFDGKGHSINLAIDIPNGQSVGLFAIVDSATIMNLTTEGYVNGNCGVGGIIGCAGSSSEIAAGLATNVYNCCNNAKITAIEQAGGIVGDQSGLLNMYNCFNAGDINLGTGLVGAASSTVLLKAYNCYSTNNGLMWDGTTENCFAFGTEDETFAGAQKLTMEQINKKEVIKDDKDLVALLNEYVENFNNDDSDVALSSWKWQGVGSQRHPVFGNMKVLDLEKSAVTIEDKIYTGENITPDVNVNGEEITFDEFESEYYQNGTKVENIKEAGAYVIKITAKENNPDYKGSVEVPFNVLAKCDFTDVKDHGIKIDGEALTGNTYGFKIGKTYKIESDVEIDIGGIISGEMLSSNKNNNVNGYTYSLTLADGDSSVKATYTPVYRYKTNGDKLEYICTNNKNDTETKTFATLIMADKTDASNEITDKKIIYGTDYDFTLNTNAPEAEEIIPGEISFQKYVSENKKGSCEQPEGAGKYFVQAEEVYDGITYSLSFDFIIEAKDIADEDVEKSVIDITYDGDTHTPAAVVKYKGNTLAEGTDYTVNVKDKTDANTYKVTISGIGNYKGTVTLDWDIDKADMTGFVFTDTAPYVKTYDAEAVDVSKKDMSADEGFKINNYPEHTTFEFTYSVKDAGGNLTPVDGAPVDAGSYVVSVMPVNPNYNCYPIQKDIVIKKAEVNLIPESKEVTYGTAKNADLGIKYTVADETVIPDADKSLFSDNAVSAFLAAENYDAKSGVAGNYDIVLDTEEFEKYDSDDADTLADYRNFAVSVEDGKLITVNPVNINDDAIEIKFNDNGKNGKYQYSEDYYSLYNLISVIYNGNVWGSDVLKENTDFVLRGNVEKYEMGDYIVQVDAISINSPTLTGRKEVEWSIGMNEVKNFAEDITYGETLVCDIMPYLIDKDATVAYNYYNADTDEKLAAAPTDAGEYYVIADVTNKSGETATFKDTFKISKKSVYAEILDYEITYKDALPNIADIVKFYSDDEGTESVTLTAAEIAEIIDFSDEFKQTVFNKGTYDYGFKPGSGNKNYEWNLKYITSSDGTFKVNPKEITEDMFEFTSKAFVLDPNTGYAEIEYELNDITEDDFSVRGDVSAYEPGSYTAAFYGKGNYTGNVKINWNVASECSYSHSISMNNSMTLNYYVADSDIKGFENVRLEVLNTATGVKEELKGERKIWDKNYGYEYRFSYTGIAAKEIGADIEAVLIAEKDGVEYRFNKDTYSIKEYCYTQLDKPSNDQKLKTMLVDLLNYCSEAQKYFKYDTENLVNAELTDEQKAFGTAEAPNVKSCEETIKLDGATASVSGKTLVFGNSVELKFYMNLQNIKNTDNVKLNISYTDSHNNPVTKDLDFDTFKFSHDEKYGDEYTAKYSGLNAADFGVPVSVTIMDGDKAISDTLVYSIESYAEKFIGKNDISDVLVEMMKYSKSADAYLNK